MYKYNTIWGYQQLVHFCTTFHRPATLFLFFFIVQFHKMNTRKKNKKEFHLSGAAHRQLYIYSTIHNNYFRNNI